VGRARLGVGCGDPPAAGEAVDVAPAVRVARGVCDGPGVEVTVTVPLTLGLGVELGALTGVSVGVCDGVATGVRVALGRGVCVPATAAVVVGDGVEVATGV
jgi:hypothetical protein